MSGRTAAIDRARLRSAVVLGDIASGLSRLLRRGSGSVISGRVIELVAPDAFATMLQGRTIAIVSGTNGKSTTTALLSAALRTAGPVATNVKGANMPAGIVAALAHAPAGSLAVLEVDEGYLPVATAAAPVAVVVLLNLSRDQLDRVAEVRKTADRWRATLETATATVVANADDPSVVFAARAAESVVWVAAGSNWRVDAASCPNCGARIEFAGADAWSCELCDLARPPVDWSFDAHDRIVTGDPQISGRPLELSIPGRHNRTNALMALAAATALGVDATAAVQAMSNVGEIEGRYDRIWGADHDARLYLAKNPAGWLEILDLLTGSTRDVVIVINANIADGLDTSWLWDVPFEQLRGKRVIASGQRSHDLAVRLLYADVDTTIDVDLQHALTIGRTDNRDVVANYTAFRDVRRALGVGR